MILSFQDREVIAKDIVKKAEGYRLLGEQLKGRKE